MNREKNIKNYILNYIYAIIRAQVAKSLIGSGLFPLFGIHHKNMYNSLCLADDIMEPFRPFADSMIKRMLIDNPSLFAELELSKTIRQTCLSILNYDVNYDGNRKPFQIATQSVCAKLAQCYESKNPNILIYPEYE